jgi:hypothetical protein
MEKKLAKRISNIIAIRLDWLLVGQSNDVFMKIPNKEAEISISQPFPLHLMLRKEHSADWTSSQSAHYVTHTRPELAAKRSDGRIQRLGVDIEKQRRHHSLTGDPR